MLQERWTAIDSYIGENLVPADPVLEAALQASADAGLPVGSKGYDGFALAVVLAAP